MVDRQDPTPVENAQQACRKARKAYDEAQEKSRRAVDKAKEAYDEAWTNLHQAQEAAREIGKGSRRARWQRAEALGVARGIGDSR